MITQYDRNGFRMDFVNGYSISVIWHQGSYSDNRADNMPTSSSVEVGIFPTMVSTNKFIFPDSMFNPQETNDPMPYVDIELLAKLISWTQGLRSVTQ